MKLHICIMQLTLSIAYCYANHVTFTKVITLHVYNVNFLLIVFDLIKRDKYLEFDFVNFNNFIIEVNLRNQRT